MLRSLHIRIAVFSVAALVAVGEACPAADAHDAEHGGGIASDLPFWGLVAFIGFLIAVKKLGWDSLTSSMREREETENRLIADAETLRERTAEQLRKNRGLMEALDEHVQEALAEAQRDADHTRRDIRSVADREAALSRQRAELEIGRTRDQSLNELFATTAAHIAEQAERRIREQLTPETQQRLMDAAVGEFVTQKA